MSTDKITRTVRLTPEIDARLRALAEHLGTNVNAYLISEIGKAVSRDELAFLASKNNSNLYSQMLPMLEGLNAMASQLEEEQTDMFEEK